MIARSVATIGRAIAIASSSAVSPPPRSRNGRYPDAAASRRTLHRAYASRSSTMPSWPPSRSAAASTPSRFRGMRRSRERTGEPSTAAENVAKSRARSLPTVRTTGSDRRPGGICREPRLVDRRTGCVRRERSAMPATSTSSCRCDSPRHDDRAPPNAATCARARRRRGRGSAPDQVEPVVDDDDR